MIYEQPVVYEWEQVAAPTLLVIAQEDRTVVGKHQLKTKDGNRYGNYPALGKATQKRIRGARLLELEGVGHIPHIQEPKLYAVLRFFND